MQCLYTQLILFLLRENEYEQASLVYIEKHMCF